MIIDNLIETEKIFEEIKVFHNDAVRVTNSFCEEKMLTRGGRVGSGMGTLLEALWGFNMNQFLIKNPDFNYEIAWFPDNEYNDFACIKKDSEWTPSTRRGELFRIEIKSMNSLADESKGHFNEIQDNMTVYDLLVVLIWSWGTNDGIRFFPYIDDYFIGRALDIAKLRDKLHLARGGTFVDAETCPDNCTDCRHHGEPLNINGNRERISGPISCKPRGSSHAANFGGLVRMIKTSNDEMRHAFRKIRAEDDAVHEYISFVHRNFPNEELNQYTVREWKELARSFDIDIHRTKQEIVQTVRETIPDYQTKLRNLYQG